MSTQESAGAASLDPVQDSVDAFPVSQTPLDRNQTNLEEAMEVREENSVKSLTYPMTHPNRGIALIINNEEFLPQTEMSPRTGSTQDANRLKNVLEEKLNFNVIMCKDLTVIEMKRKFEDIAMIDHSQNDCFLGVILSHGEDGGIISGTDGSVALDYLISYILPNKCPSLGGKPKLFFVQACRGTKLDGGFCSEIKYKKIPVRADILIVYSSVPGYYSFRNKKGSWFIQSLCKMLEIHGNDMEIHQILTKVNFHVAYEYESNSNDPAFNGMKQVPEMTSTLTKELKFSPKQQTTSE